MLSKLLTSLITLIVLGFCLAFLLVFVRGDIKDNAFRFQQSSDINPEVEGPFELTNSTSRYVLTQAIVENHTFALTEKQARLASPDLVKFKDTYLSIFTPGISMLAVPFYMLGNQWQIPQLGAYSLNLLFAILCVWLVSRVTQKLGASLLVSLTAGTVFLFATNAVVYSTTLTQHLASTALLLGAILISAEEPNIKRNLRLGVILGLGLLIDIPNAFLLLPAILVVINKHISFSNLRQQFELKISPLIFVIALTALPLVFLFGYYNWSLTGSATTLGQFIGRYDFPATNVDSLTEEIKTRELLKKSEPQKVETKIPKLGFGITLPFNSRLQLEGMHILLISKQRSWLYYSPVILLGILGLILALSQSKNTSIAATIWGSIVMNILIYSSFGDPWGGWAFGPRYLIPSAALLCVGLGVLISAVIHKKNLLIILAFSAIFLWLLKLSVFTATLGALTTAAIPPKGEAEALKNDTPWTTEYNQRLVNRQKISSLAYKVYFDESLSEQQFVNNISNYLFVSLSLLYCLAVLSQSNIGRYKRKVS